LASASVDQYQQPATNGEAPRLRRAAPQRREPVWQDYLLYFFGIPVLLAFVFSLVGTRLTYGMPYTDALVYMTLHMFTAWWSVNLGAAIIKFSFRNWRPPVIAVCLMGLLIALIPAAFLFQTLGDFYAARYPVFATNRHDIVAPAWNFAYLLHFIRYSLPVLPTFLAGVYGYRFVTGVNWFGYRRSNITTTATATATANLETTAKPGKGRATAGLIAGSQLPADAELLAIKAEQHYIQIWSDQGTDMVRYRFKDLANSLAECNGAQVHRSWWVNLDQVTSCNQDGRKMDLIIEDELTVPVSLSYKNAVLGILDRRA
jgi:hypothetical protein